MVLLFSGCSPSPKKPTQYLNSNVSGKFVFSSKRNESGNYRLCILKKGMIEVVGVGRACHRWSPNGEAIAATGKNVIDILNKDGVIINSINTKEQVIELNWFPDGKRLLLSAVIGTRSEIQTRVCYLSIYDIESGIEKELFRSESGYHEILGLSISHDGQRILFESDALTLSRTNYTYTINADGTNLKAWREHIRPIGWLPDSKSFLFSTNIKNIKDGKSELYNNEFGRIFKLDTETGELTTIREVLHTYITDIQLTPDGKYLYYSKSFPEGGMGLAYSPLNKEEEVIVTKPFYINHRLGYSEDRFAHWHQGD